MRLWAIGVAPPLSVAVAVERQSAAQRRLEQRADDTEREMTLVRGRGGAAHEAAGCGREPRGMLEQRGLAEAGRGLEHDYCARAAGEAR